MLAATAVPPTVTRTLETSVSAPAGTGRPKEITDGAANVRCRCTRTPVANDPLTGGAVTGVLAGGIVALVIGSAPVGAGLSDGVAPVGSLAGGLAGSTGVDVVGAPDGSI